MITNKNYNPEVFNNLNDFFVARKFIENNQENLLELGDIICSYNLHQEVGISLLHKHFDLEPQEKLVEKFEDNKFYIEPCEENTDKIMPYLWKIEKDSEQECFNFFPLEFFHSSGINPKVKKVADSIIKNHNFLSEISQKLDKLELTNIFGVSILHRDAISLEEDEIIVETTDEVSRRLICSATIQSNIAPNKLTQTLWQFTPNELLNSAGACIGHNKCSHCVRHCVHCLNHPWS